MGESSEFDGSWLVDPDDAQLAKIIRMSIERIDSGSRESGSVIRIGDRNYAIIVRH